jgi:ribosomal protein S4
MKEQYFAVEIHGVAVVYAESEYEARKIVENGKVTIGGNVLRHSNVEIIDGKCAVLTDAITKLEKEKSK